MCSKSRVNGKKRKLGRFLQISWLIYRMNKYQIFNDYSVHYYNYPMKSIYSISLENTFSSSTLLNFYCYKNFDWKLVGVRQWGIRFLQRNKAFLLSTNRLHSFDMRCFLLTHHYHQRLPSSQNSLNFKIVHSLMQSIVQKHQMQKQLRSIKYITRTSF